MVHVFIESKQYFNQIQYAFNILFSALGVQCVYISSLNELRDKDEDISIIYSNSEFETLGLPGTIRRLIFIKNSGRLFGDDYLKPDSIPLVACRYRTTGRTEETNDIISIYSDDKPLYISSDEDKRTIKTNIDMISDIFFMLTRYEEVVNAGVKKDRHSRFPAVESLAYKNNFLHRPVVNEHIALLGTWIESLSSGYKRPNPWGRKAFAVCLSHDVDSILKNQNLFAAFKHTIAILLKYRKPKNAVQYLKSYFQNRRDHTKDPYWTFNYLINTEKAYQFNSSFYFLALENSDPDWRYNINDSKVRVLIEELDACGCEIGYHGSLVSYNNERVMGLERHRVDAVVLRKPYGCRQHYLKFRVPFTWRYQQRSGLLYDTTLSFADHEGFRCGMCLPFKPYDLLDDHVLDLWEIPLIIMEGTLEYYRKLSPEDGLKKIVSMIETVKKHHGVFTILWHNSSFDYDWEEWKPVYEKMMEYLGKSDCIGLSGREAIEHIKGLWEQVHV